MAQNFLQKKDVKFLKKMSKDTQQCQPKRENKVNSKIISKLIKNFNVQLFHLFMSNERILFEMNQNHKN